jgi:hypothetical protein
VASISRSLGDECLSCSSQTYPRRRPSGVGTSAAEGGDPAESQQGGSLPRLAPPTARKFGEERDANPRQPPHPLRVVPKAPVPRAYLNTGAAVFGRSGHCETQQAITDANARAPDQTVPPSFFEPHLLQTFYQFTYL